MEYLKVRWIHQLPGEPVLLLSELDSDRYEVRKIEIFRNGRMAFASEAESAHGSRLGETAVPPSNEIAADPEFLIQSTAHENSRTHGVPPGRARMGPTQIRRG